LNISENINLFSGFGPWSSIQGFLDLSHMPTLYKVCVWEMPFPPAGVSVYTDDSPNIYFTTDCD